VVKSQEKKAPEIKPVLLQESRIVETLLTKPILKE